MGRSSDFRFWEEKLPGDDADLQFEDEVGPPSSPPLWKRPPFDRFRNETTPLLPNKNYSSPSSRLRAIMEGKRELTEMIKNLPESAYELSLKDIVDDDQRKLEEVHEKKVKSNTDNRTAPKSKMAKSMCRTESMESEVFLLKMFLPLPLSFKKKPNARKQSPEGGCENKGSKEWWKMIFVAVKDNNKNRKINRSTSDISSNRNTTSLAENSLIPCKWSFGKTKSKSTGQRGCLF